MKYTFKFEQSEKNVQMFSEKYMGIVIEKEPQTVCVYATDDMFSNIFCATPIGSPEDLRDEEYAVEFCENDIARIFVADIQIVMDFSHGKCANNKGFKSYGFHGNEVQVEWGII
jgi:hypothetical protein